MPHYDSLIALTSMLGGSGEGAVEDFTCLDDSPLGTLCLTEWKDRVMYYAEETIFSGMPLNIAIVAWFPPMWIQK